MTADLTKKSGILHLSLFLLAVCGIAAALMVLAKIATDEPIAKAEKAKVNQGLSVVLEGVDYGETVETVKDSIYAALKDGKPVAYAVKTSSPGYGGPVEGLIGFDAEGKILRFIVTGQNETPGIGSKVTSRTRVRTISDVVKGVPADTSLPPNATLDSFRGKKASGAAKWTKADVHFVTGATVSSNAVTELAWKASVLLNDYLAGRQKSKIKESK